MRSGHPTFSVAASGKLASYLTANRELNAALGHGSSYEDALNSGSKILLLGVGNNRNSMLHYIEVASDLPYNDIPFRQFWSSTALVDKNGKPEELSLASVYPACSENFSWLDKLLIEEGISTEGQVGGTHSYLMGAQHLKDFVIGQIKRKPDCMLCSNIVCEPCSLRRKRLKAVGLL